MAERACRWARERGSGPLQTRRAKLRAGSDSRAQASAEWRLVRARARRERRSREAQTPLCENLCCEGLLRNAVLRKAKRTRNSRVPSAIAAGRRLRLNRSPTPQAASNGPIKYPRRSDSMRAAFQPACAHKRLNAQADDCERKQYVAGPEQHTCRGCERYCLSRDCFGHLRFLEATPNPSRDQVAGKRRYVRRRLATITTLGSHVMTIMVW